MKWAIIGLSLLGLAAATCAALLVTALRANNGSAKAGIKDDSEVQILCATVNLDPMTVIVGDMVATKTVLRSAAPPQYIGNPVQVVGRVLTVPVVAGQPFTATNFAADSSASLAAAVAKGKRAVGISVTDFAGLDGLLYPGSVVDVLVTLRPSEAANGAQYGAMATTLLERVQVLAIEKQTVVSGTAEQAGNANAVTGADRFNNSRRITLLVDTKQAKALQLAMQQGTLSLSLRNPLDTGAGDETNVSLSSITGESDQAPDKASAKPSAWESFLNRLATAKPRPATTATGPKDVFASEPTVEVPQWQTTVIRGEATQVLSFPTDANKKSATETAPAQTSAAGGTKIEAEAR